MNRSAPHPARSAEFLSRLHDGDLTAAERVQFESHRAHCAECRNAAAQFEAALSLYRSSRPRPAAPDLSARILRKLQSSTPRRSPFGVTFGIDLRWAGAFAAALLAVMIGSAVLLRREAGERRVLRETAAIPVLMERDSTNANVVKDQAAPTTPTIDLQDTRRAAAAAPGVSSRKTADSFSPAPPAPARTGNSTARIAAARGLAGAEVSSARESLGRVASAQPVESKPEAPAAAQRTANSPAPADRAGGEGSLSSNLSLDSSATRVHLDITAADEAGAAPLLLNGAHVELPTELHGREFRLIVETTGHVREVTAIDTGLRKKAILRQEAARSDAGAAEEKAAHPLKALRFEPGDRPRILRVRIE